MIRKKYVDSPYARAGTMPAHGERPNISIMIHMAVMAKKMNPAGVFTAFTMLPTVFLTICDGYFTLMRYAGMPPNIPPVHWASSPVASRIWRMSLHMPSYCSMSCCGSTLPSNCGAKQ